MKEKKDIKASKFNLTKKGSKPVALRWCRCGGLHSPHKLWPPAHHRICTVHKDGNIKHFRPFLASVPVLVIPCWLIVVSAKVSVCLGTQQSLNYVFSGVWDFFYHKLQDHISAPTNTPILENDIISRKLPALENFLLSDEQKKIKERARERRTNNTRY